MQYIVNKYHCHS